MTPLETLGAGALRELWLLACATAWLIGFLMVIKMLKWFKDRLPEILGWIFAGSCWRWRE